MLEESVWWSDDQNIRKVVTILCVNNSRTMGVIVFLDRTIRKSLNFLDVNFGTIFDHITCQVKLNNTRFGRCQKG